MTSSPIGDRYAQRSAYEGQLPLSLPYVRSRQALIGDEGMRCRRATHTGDEAITVPKEPALKVRGIETLLRDLKKQQW